jgi:hypothetical protein
MAGLVGGDSDSSALTQESGDEGTAVTPRDSVITGTDAGTESEEDHADVQEASPGKVIFLLPYFSTDVFRPIESSTRPCKTACSRWGSGPN